MRAGMDIARFNFSHGSHEEHRGRVDMVKNLREELNIPVALLLDTKGPEIRTKLLKDHKKITLEAGSEFTLTTGDIEGDETRVAITYENLYKDVKKGGKILIDDGLIELEIENIKNGDIVCRVLNGGELGERKGINVPYVNVKLPGITEQDKDDILFGITQEFDYIAASFVRDAKAIKEIRQLLAKIEQEGKGRLVINRGSSYYQLNGSRITDKGFVLLIMDVTARTASEKIRREFSANVSHELKTPLQSVLGYSEIMLSGLVKPEDTKRFLQKINDEAHNLLRLIDDIMQLSKLDELTHDMMEKFTLQDVAQSALARLKDKAGRLQVSLQLVDSTGGDSKLLGISSLMEEIFFNLLDNGLKYNHPGGEVTLRLSEGENKYTVSVADTGMGIPGSELPHIFERFYRVDRSRHKAIEGTGLGLSIVKHGVGFHGGSIRVVSTVGQGTEFIMKFPKPKYEAEK